MKANELRVGNLIQEFDRFFTVIEIAELSVTYESLDRRQRSCPRYEYISPIPLTEEWFLKFGFKLFNGCYWIKNRFELAEEEPGYWERSTGFGGYKEDGVSIQYVHQLQNLYFVITGEELTISSET